MRSDAEAGEAKGAPFPWRWLTLGMLMSTGVVVLVAAGFVFLLSLATYDHTTRIFGSVVGDATRGPHGGVLPAIVRTRFGAGTPTADVDRFFIANDGRCSASYTGSGARTCVLPLSGSFCQATELGVTYREGAPGIVAALDASVFTTSC